MKRKTSLLLRGELIDVQDLGHIFWAFLVFLVLQFAVDAADIMLVDKMRCSPFHHLHT